jgi:hypothetical protein
MQAHRRTGPVVLIVVGTVFLLVNLDVVPVAALKRALADWWPMILIFLGVWGLQRSRRHDQ